MQYRQRLIDGQPVFVQVADDAETDPEPTAHPFDEKGKHMPSSNASKKAEREAEREKRATSQPLTTAEAMSIAANGSRTQQETEAMTRFIIGHMQELQSGRSSQ